MLFAEYYDDDKQRIDGINQRCWLNIDFKRPKQEKLKENVDIFTYKPP